MPSPHEPLTPLPIDVIRSRVMQVREIHHYETVTCPECGEDFERRTNVMVPASWCSRPCRDRSAYRRRIAQRIVRRMKAA